MAPMVLVLVLNRESHGSEGRRHAAAIAWHMIPLRASQPVQYPPWPFSSQSVLHRNRAR